MTDSERATAWAETLPRRVEEAFDFRGHVTLVTTDGREIVGYLSNRRADGPDPYVQLVPKGAGSTITLPWREIRDLRLTGRDPASRPLRMLAPVGRDLVPSATGPIALVAALETELAGLGLKGRRREPFEHSWAECGSVGDARVVTLATGPGRERAARAIDELLATGPCAAIVCLGFAGGLDPALCPGTLVLTHRVRLASEPMSAIDLDPELAARVMAAAAARGLALRTGLAVTVDSPLRTPATKRQWALATGAALVDLETFWIARAAATRGVPWIAVRAIVDAADETLPAFVTAPTGRSVRDYAGPALRHALSTPTGLLDLIRLGGEAQRAQRALGRAGRVLAEMLANRSGAPV